jgi:hypothetical protein
MRLPVIHGSRAPVLLVVALMKAWFLKRAPPTRKRSLSNVATALTYYSGR